MAAPRTSFIIPARNAAATLAQTLDSVLAQGDGDWEALVIDDGSSDETPQLIGAHAQRDARIVALRGGSTPGVSAARNVGLKQARGQRLVFLDSDDWIERAFLERMHAALDAAPGAAAAYCDYCRVMPGGALSPAYSDPDVGRAPFDTFARTCAVAIHAVLIERDCVQRAGGFDATLGTCEDWDLWQRVARLGSRWVHVAAPLALYRTREDSLSRDVDRVLADAAVVIRRGFGADPRLPDCAGAHAAGASPAPAFSADIALAYCTLWCLALDAARGRDRPQQHEALAALPRGSEHALDIATTVLDGVALGLCAVPAQLAARWSEYGQRITALIDDISAPGAAAVAARRVQYAFERLVLQHDGLAATRSLSLTTGLRVDLRALPTLTPAAGVDRLYVELCDGDRVLAVVEPGVLGTMAPQQWTELAARRLGWRKVMKIAGPSAARWLTPGGLADAARSTGRAVVRRVGVADSKQALRIPVLRYRRVGHERVGVEAFTAQLAWLRCQGYHTLAAAELVQTLERRRPLVDRPLMITFDDADPDFADTAWPLLRRHELRATVFAATDLVGTAAPPMAAHTIARLAAEGVSFGCHLARHRGADGLTTRELAEELTRSRAALGAWVGAPIDAFAAPCGVIDERLALLAATSGYRLGFGIEPGAIAVHSDPMNLPRIEVRGDMALAEFAAAVQASR